MISIMSSVFFVCNYRFHRYLIFYANKNKIKPNKIPRSPSLPPAAPISYKINCNFLFSLSIATAFHYQPLISEILSFANFASEAEIG